MEIPLEDNVLDFLRESNYIENERSEEAMEDASYAWQRLMREDDFHMSNLVRLHYDLMHQLNPRIAGRIRMCQVRVGDYVCPNPSALSILIPIWFDKHSKAETEEDIKKAHIAFEVIHPFEDGNGRAGRIIMNWQRVKAGLPILIIKESEVQEYYKWFDEQGKRRKWLIHPTQKE